MTWHHYLTEARTGLITKEIDIPSFSGSMTVSSFGFSTTEKGTGTDGENSLTLPFSQFDQHDEYGNIISRATPSEINALIGMGRAGQATTWSYDGCANPLGIPILWGALADREDHWLDTTFSLSCTMDLLDSRLAVRDGAYHDGTSTDTLSWQGLSLRGLAAELGSLATEQKNYGQLPIRWNYRGEQGNHQRNSYSAWNIQNLNIKTLLTNLSNTENGPDMGFRPTWADNTHIINDFIAASDGDIYLAASKTPPTFTVSPYGGTLEVTSLSWLPPIQRWYGTGAGTDASTITALAEDISQLSSKNDPPILYEATYSDTDITDQQLLKSKLLARLAARKQPIAQLTGTVNLDDQMPNGQPIHPLGSFWPGERINADINGFRTLSDDRYPLRLMEIDFNQSHNVTLKTDVFMPDI
ncbi:MULTISPECIES: hypothetical protein [Bifidobacterium]|uniref:Uncharacterized protein n=1 Tax=Bifidobacterium tibiigranuli TaxID=2172043 RepID=A0A5N6SBD2_9BIFI|nr:hypothetical protein [Bifidobacterium tibiigranuli]KAE8130207.1 hypothetical protein DDE84_01115 [Bifidobacterium tibiigranuli]KAE8130434.1 hypothetical protein DDF78_00540 [Bifidobacterium tibiigranuli]